MASTFSFNVYGSAEGSNPGITGSGVLNGTPEAGGAYDILASGSSATFTIGATTYNATVIGNPNYPSASEWPTIAGTSYDDKYTPGVSPFVDANGLLFLLSGDGSLNGEELGIWYNSATTGLYANQDIWDVSTTSGTGLINNAVGGDPISFAPEPNSLLLMGTGLLCMAGFLFRRKALQGSF
jgi:hypothetical protein